MCIYIYICVCVYIYIYTYTCMYTIHLSNTTCLNAGFLFKRWANDVRGHSGSGAQGWKFRRAALKTIIVIIIYVYGYMYVYVYIYIYITLYIYTQTII